MMMMMTKFGRMVVESNMSKEQMQLRICKSWDMGVGQF